MCRVASRHHVVLQGKGAPPRRLHRPRAAVSGAPDVHTAQEGLVPTRRALAAPSRCMGMCPHNAPACHACAKQRQCKGAPPRRLNRPRAAVSGAHDVPTAQQGLVRARRALAAPSRVQGHSARTTARPCQSSNVQSSLPQKKTPADGLLRRLHRPCAAVCGDHGHTSA